MKTKEEVKIKIFNWVKIQQTPFTTQQVKEVISPIATNIYLSPQRLTKYIQSTGQADYDKARKAWSKRIKIE